MNTERLFNIIVTDLTSDKLELSLTKFVSMVDNNTKPNT